LILKALLNTITFKEIFLTDLEGLKIKRGHIAMSSLDYFKTSYAIFSLVSKGQLLKDV
jgi:hypothetical protein